MERSSPLLLLVGKPGHLRDAIAGLVSALPVPNRLLCADSGLLALKAARENLPALVLVTTGLPETEAPELVLQIKQLWPQTACVVMAEKSEQQRQAFLAGADCVLQGGVDSEKLLSAIESQLHK